MTSFAYYNEHDAYAAQWLRNLIEAGHIAPGYVDERDLWDVRPDDLRDFTQCHFFAGIGIWSHALRRIGWPDDRPIWSGSCPCQPFSAAGKGLGFADERHLWPAWFHLITQCRPAIVIGEQVASKDGLGWLDLVSADMEATGYAFGASDLCAAGFQESHLRQRLYFVGVADAEHYGRRADEPGRGPERRTVNGGSGGAMRLANAPSVGQPGSGGRGDIKEQRVTERGTTGGLADPDGENQSGRGIRGQREGGSESLRPALERPARLGEDDGLAGRGDALCNPGQIAARWLNVDWLLCRNPAGDPSWRPVEPGTFPLAHGITARMDKLRAYGNGLDAETATNFLRAAL